MKIVLSFYLLFIFLTTTLLANAIYTQEELEYIKNNKVKVAMLPDLAPFSSLINGKLSGFSYDLLELISKKSSLKFEYEVGPWPQNLEKFKEKKVDIIDSISFKESRLEFTNFTKAYYEIPLMIFSRKDLNDYTNLFSLKGKKLGITKDIFYKNLLEELNLFTLVEFDSFQDKLKALAYGDVDIIFGHLQSTQILINEKRYTNIKALDELDLPNLKKTDLRFGIVKENKILFDIVRKTYDTISQVEWNQLKSRWIDIYDHNNVKNNIIEDLTTDERLFLVEKRFKCSVASWPPFIQVKDKITGVSMDFWELIKKRALIDSKCEVEPNVQTVFEKIKEKDTDLTIASTISEESLKYGKFSVPYLNYPIAIATTLDKRYISETSELIDQKIGVVKGQGIGKILLERYPELKIVNYESDILALKALTNNDIYALVEILPVLSNAIKEYGFNNIKISGTTEFNYNLRVMVRNDYEKLIPIINKAIKTISNTEIEDIKNRWISIKYERAVDYTKLWQIAIVVLIILIVMIYRQMVLNVHNRELRIANKNIEQKTNELKMKTKELTTQKKLFEKMFNESSDGLLIASMSLDPRLISCNDKACEILGYKDKNEILTKTKYDLLPQKQPDGNDTIKIIEAYFANTIKNGSSSFELVHLKKDGTTVWLEVVLTSINFDDQELLHIIWRDIQNRKDIEEKLNQLTHNLEERVKDEILKNEEKTKQLIKQSRHAQMGEMISMIAHQWRQPLTAISATTNNILIRMMLGEKVSEKDLEKELSLVSDYSLHLSRTIDDFRNFFKMDKVKVNVTLEEIIENSLIIVKNSLESNNIKIIKDFKCNESFLLHATEIYQVILNLIKNSQDALVDNLVLDSQINIKTYCENHKAYIEISDNANGINEKIIDKIFDPYFSTKIEKEGTGLGLYMSKIIINDHCKGEITVKNGENGAIFKIVLPVEKLL